MNTLPAKHLSDSRPARNHHRLPHARRPAPKRRTLSVEALEDRRLLSVGPVAGKGMWIWHWSLTEGGSSSAMISQLQSANVKWVAVKCGDSDYFYPESDRLNADRIAAVPQRRHQGPWLAIRLFKRSIQRAKRLRGRCREHNSEPSRNRRPDRQRRGGVRRFRKRSAGDRVHADDPKCSSKYLYRVFNVRPNRQPPLVSISGVREVLRRGHASSLLGGPPDYAGERSCDHERAVGPMVSNMDERRPCGLR